MILENFNKQFKYKSDKEIQGDSNFTFGEVCGNSDRYMLENPYTCKEYIEFKKS